MLKFIVFVLSLFFISCINDTSSPSNSLNGFHYVDDGLGLKIDLVPYWQNSINSSKNGQAYKAASFAPQENGFSANVLIVDFPHEGTSDMHEVLDLYKSEIQKAIPDVEFELDTVLTIDGIEVAKVIYTLRLDINGRYYLLTGKELLFVKNNRDVQIVFTDQAITFGGRFEFESVEESLAFF